MAKTDTDERVKITIRLPRRLIRAGKHYAVDHECDLQDVVAQALAHFLESERRR